MAYEEPQGRAGQTRPAVAPVWGVTWRENCPQCPLSLCVSLWVSAPYFALGEGSEGAGSLPASLTQSVGENIVRLPYSQLVQVWEKESTAKERTVPCSSGGTSPLSQEGRVHLHPRTPRSGSQGLPYAGPGLVCQLESPGEEPCTGPWK